MYRRGSPKGVTRFAIKPGPEAKTVQLAGDFSNWAPVAMKRQKGGLYVADVPAVRGVYQYKFVVDGQWLVDPDHEARTANRFGTANSVAPIA